MAKKVGMVHAMHVPNGILFKKLASEVLPGVEVVSFIDEGLPGLSGKQNHKRVVWRISKLAELAKDSGAAALLLTCTAFGRLEDEVMELVNIPVLSVLEIVTREAMKLGDQIGILGSHPGTVATAEEILKEDAIHAGRKIKVTTCLCEGAFDALKKEDWTTHDRIIIKYLRELMPQVKVIIIPQPSIDSVVNKLPESERKVPILTSARLSINKLKEKLDTL